MAATAVTAAGTRDTTRLEPLVTMVSFYFYFYFITLTFILQY